MRLPSFAAAAAAACLVAVASSATPAAAQLDARLMREPAVSATQIAFVYAGDIWIAPREGGLAVRVSSPKGEESFPRFSPDGKELAFTADYDGNEEVYVMPVGGGEALRLTHHPGSDRVVNWTPDGGAVLFASGRQSGRQRFNQLYEVRRTGGLPTKLPVPYGEFGDISADGQWLAYTPQSRDFRTWKRYRGGWASRIWLFNLKTHASKLVSTTAANDGQPMWHGRTLYFLSDRGPAERANIWAYNVDSGTVRQVTHYTDFDIHFPSVGPKDIVFEKGGQLFLLDLATEQAHQVAIRVVTDEATLRPRLDSVSRYIHAAWISPTAKRAVFGARGDVFTVPAEHGPILDLTRSPGVAERYPTWSPDGKWMAYFTDRSGEYQLAIRPADGTGTEEVLTHLGPGFRYRPFWSPDGRKLAFIDQAMTIWVFDRDTRRLSRVDKALYYFEGALANWRPSWSADSRWLAYARDLPNRHDAIFLWDARADATHRVTAGFYDASSPAFDPEGKYLYYLTVRSPEPLYSNVDNTWIYTNGTVVAAASLRPDVPSPLAPRNDTEPERPTPAAREGEKGGGKAAAAKNGAAKDTVTVPPKPVEIDLDGLESRVTLLPLKAGNYGELQAVAGKVVFLHGARSGSGTRRSDLAYYDLKERKEETVVDSVSDALVAANGEKVLVRQGRTYAIVDLKPKQKLEKRLATSGLVMTVDPRAEWKQIFTDVWRFERDYFYDPHMHGVDWNAVRGRYAGVLRGAVTRWDVNFVIGEMIAELSSSHTYRGGGDLQQGPRRTIGMLGVDWTLDHGAYRIARIIRGAPWDTVRSPLDRPGVGVKAGDYVLSVNGIPLDTAQDPWAAFDGLGDQTVTLAVNERPTLQGARQVLVHTMDDETALRFAAWIEAKRHYVDSVSNGRIGYVYVPNTGIDGQTDLVQQYLAQIDKAGMIIDERWNSGGQIPDRFIELLDRPPLAFWAVRDGRDWQWPPAASFGPKAMLINGWSGSGGDAFPFFFKERKLGPLIGMRTWGGLIGYTGVPSLIDNGGVTVPSFRMYDPTGQWFPEGHGVDPDIRVVDDQTELARGVDPQLVKAVEVVEQALREHPFVPPKRPPYQNRTATGLEHQH